LFDPTNRLAALKSRTAHYPPLLKYTLIKRFLAAANSSLASTEKSASRGDTFHTVSGLYRSVRSLMQVLYALNERYFVTEKAAIRDVSDFLFRPPRFSEVVTTVLGSPGSTNDQLHKSVRRVRGLLRSVQKLCDFYAPGAVQPRGA